MKALAMSAALLAVAAPTFAAAPATNESGARAPRVITLSNEQLDGIVAGISGRGNDILLSGDGNDVLSGGGIGNDVVLGRGDDDPIQDAYDAFVYP